MFFMESLTGQIYPKAHFLRRRILPLRRVPDREEWGFYRFHLPNPVCGTIGQPKASINAPSFSDVKMRKTREFVPRFRELVPLIMVNVRFRSLPLPIRLQMSSSPPPPPSPPLRP